jgi:methionyl-tRNA synthetase
MKNKYFITTAIPYINAEAHVGHAQEFLLADTFKRILKNQGHSVLLQSGTDDNSLKNIIAAKEKNIELSKYVGEQGEKFKSLLSKLNIDNDLFVQTSSRKHHNAVYHFINNLNKNDLYEGEYKGLYCVGCEDFLKKEDLNNAGECPDHQKKPQEIKESNIFFKLSKYQEEIYNLINSDKVKFYPLSKKKEILNFINKGLTDISISRPIKDQSWGVPFPGKEDHTVYVWIDALINYISEIGYGEGDEWEKIWNDSHTIHVIGKNVWKFHAIYWVALLLSAKIKTPSEIIIHGFLTNNGVKISKSLGNVINPLDLLEKHDADIIRTYLLGKLNYESDGDFNENDLKSFYIEEVLNQIGNLYPRVYTIANKSNITGKREENILQNDYHNIREIYQTCLEKSQILNKTINDSHLWEKEESETKHITLKDWQKELNLISDLLEVFVPSKKDAISASFSTKKILFPKK